MDEKETILDEICRLFSYIDGEMEQIRKLLKKLRDKEDADR